MSSAPAPRRIGVFGGSFNPPHVAHQLVVLYVLETQPVDEVWLVPTWKHAFGKDLAAYDDRVAMCELAAAALGARVRVSRAEAELAARPGFVASHTLDLLQHLAAPDRELRLVIGADILHETHRWHRWADVVALAPPIAIGRGGVGARNTEAPAGVVVTGVTMPEISATAVRAKLHAGDADVAALLPREVLRYIAEHELYR